MGQTVENGEFAEFTDLMSRHRVDSTKMPKMPSGESKYRAGSMPPESGPEMYINLKLM
jgi:hypothetical protein